MRRRWREVAASWTREIGESRVATPQLSTSSGRLSSGERTAMLIALIIAGEQIVGILILP